MRPTAVVCAYAPVGHAALQGLLDADVNVLALYTYPQPAEDAWFEAPETLARRRGIPVHHAPAFNTDDVYAHLRGLAPDFLFSFYFREMIQAHFLDLPRRGAFNLHGSLLPKYRGRAPLNWVLVKGETETGLTLHAMTPRPDDGDIVAQVRLPIAWDETALSLTLRAAEAARPLVASILPKLVDGTAPRIPQATRGRSSYFGGRRPEDSRLTFDMTAREAFDQIRAVADPWPNAFLETHRGRLKLPWALPTTQPCPPGHFRATTEGVLIGFADGALRIVALRQGDRRSERPTEQAAWLKALELPEAP